MINQEYKVSVIIPVYNTERYLSETVNSLINQELKSIEIILIDDGSTDSSGLLCDKLNEQYSNISVIHKENEGLGLTRNRGIDSAHGEYIAFIDSDDKIKSDYLITLYSKAKKYDLDICYSNGYFFFDDNHDDETQIHNYYFMEDTIFETHKSLKECISRTIDNNCHTNDALPGSSCMSIYRLEFLKSCNLRFLSERVFISEDIWFNMDCINAAHRIGYIPYTGYFYRYNQNSLSRGYRNNRFDGLYSSVIALDKKCIELELDDFRGRINMYFWTNFEKCINQEVRYSVKNGLQNIRKMCEASRTRTMLKYIYEEKLNDKLHGLLCGLLYKRKYKTCYALLVVYNLKMHRRNNNKKNADKNIKCFTL